MTGSEHHTHTQHTTQHTKTRLAATAAALPPEALPYISMAISISAMTPNHGAVAPHESLAGAWQWVCSRHGWFPWLGHRIKMHQKIERGTGPQP
jgi:hypothetical protein